MPHEVASLLDEHEESFDCDFDSYHDSERKDCDDANDNSFAEKCQLRPSDNDEDESYYDLEQEGPRVEETLIATEIVDWMSIGCSCAGDNHFAALDKDLWKIASCRSPAEAPLSPKSQPTLQKVRTG